MESTVSDEDARRKVVCVTLDWINQLNVHQLRAVLRGFVTDELAFSSNNLTMMANVLQSTKNESGVKARTMYDAMLLFGDNDAAMRRWQHDFPTKQAQAHSAQQHEARSTQERQKTADSQLQELARMQSELNAAKKTIHSAAQREMAAVQEKEALADEHKEILEAKDLELLASRERVTTVVESREKLKVKANEMLREKINELEQIQDKDSLAALEREEAQRQWKVSERAKMSDEIKKQFEEAQKENRRSDQLNQGRQQRNAKILCGICKKYYLEKDNDEDSCSYHTGELIDYGWNRGPYCNFNLPQGGRWWNCCRRQPNSQGCHPASHEPKG